MSNPQADLLRQLSIDRSAAPPPSSSRTPWLIGAALLVAGGVGFALLRGGGAVPVRAVSVEVKGGAAAAAGGSVLDASGYVVARRQATVSSKVTGKVTEILFEEGQKVEEGQVLARLDASNVATQLALTEAQVQQARAQLAELKVSLANAERDARRNRDLLERKLVSQAALDNADTAVAQLQARLASAEQGVRVAERQVGVTRQQSDDTVVRAPFAGVITVKNAQPGEMISPLSAGGAGTRTGLGTLVDMGSLEVEVDVNENFLNKVKPNQRASTKLNAYPDWEIPSELIAIIPTADRSKATVKVRVGFSRKPGEAMDPRILPDMGARVSFLADSPAPAAAPQPRRVLMPAEALDGDAVWLLADGKVSRRAVRTAPAENGYLAVTEGLSGGESLAVGEFAKLKDGAAVNVEGAK